MFTMDPLYFFVGWIGLTSLVTFCLFGYDKGRAGREGARRVAESTLLAASAFGGWPGGLLAILVFRHKTSKISFLLRFFVALFAFAAFCVGALKIIGKL